MSKLSTLYKLYNGIANTTEPIEPPVHNPRFDGCSNPRYHTYRHQIIQNRDKLKEDCAKHIIVDIYTKTLPFDKEYMDDNATIPCNDVDQMLSDKNMTPMQYFKSAYEETKAPFYEFVIRSINNICQEYTEDAVAKIDKDEEDGIDVPPDTENDSENVEGQLVDIKGDIEYEDFITKLKNKTIKKIVNEVSKLISDKKDEKEMTFDPKMESSSFSVAMQYIVESFTKHQLDISNNMDDVIGLAIRESVLNSMDNVFGQPNCELRLYENKIRLGKGVLINESAMNELYFTTNKK